jgi:uncharacterized protein YkwD
VPADGRLCAVAEALLAWQGDEVPAHVRAPLGQYFGLPGGAPEMVLATIETDDPRLIAERLTETIQGYGSRAPGPRYGLAVNLIAGKRGERAGKDDAGRTRLVLALYSEVVQLDPVPRRLELGQKATLAGTLAGDTENPKVLISDAQGRFTTLEPPPGKAFKAELACEAKPGRIMVEIRGEEMGNERVLASFSVACATELPATVALAPPVAWPAEPERQEQKMADLINAERTGAGLPPLTWLPPLGKIARAVAEQMRDGAKKGAVVVPVNIVQRLNEADVTAPVVLQNPAAAPSGETAHDRLMASPSHRANIMSTEVTHGGLGVAVGADASGKPVVYVTQLFIKVLPPPDLPAVKQTIRDVIARKRAKEKLAVLVQDPTLEQLAQGYAAAVAAGEGRPPKEKYDALVKALDKGFRKVEILTSVKLDPADYAEEPNVLSTGKFVGLGAALGKHPAYGKNSVFVVLLIGNKR